MRYIIFVWFAAAVSVYGQERIYLVTRTGGLLNGGTMLSFDPEGANINVDLNFGMNFRNPRHVNIVGTDGFLYGIAYGGRAFGGVFKIRPDGTGYEQVLDFNDQEGASAGSLVISDDGIIYGATYSHGANGGGLIFSIDQNGSHYKRLYNFPGIFRATQDPATIIIGSDGLLYGTSQIGSGYDGNIYAISKDGSGFREVLNFSSVDVANPYGLCQGIDGKLYSLSKGATGSLPTLFRVNTDGSNFEAIHQFAFDDRPGYGITQGSNGRIYGTLGNGSGAIFSCSPDGGDYQVLHTFNPTDGAEPSGCIVQASDGFLYGRTRIGGINGRGTVFRLQTDGSNFEVLNHSSIGETSSTPYVDDSGVFYSFTEGGGENSKGTLFKVSGGTEQILYNFGMTDSTAYYPYEGVTNVDGTSLALVVPSALYPEWVPTIVGVKRDQSLITYSLPDQTRSSAISRPVNGTDGFLYAATPSGGGNSAGYLFKTKSDGSEYMALHHFAPSTGVAPSGEMLVGLDGRIYGTCWQGGNHNFGVVYAVNTDGIGYAVLHHFNYPTGEMPAGGLIQGSDGTIYGTARNVFSIRPDGTNYQQLHDFMNNEYPGGELSLVGKYLYGALATGGSANKGAIYRIKTDGSDYSIVHNFNGDDGERPYSGMLQYAGALYGATSAGGAFELGTVYKLNASGTDFTKVMDLNHLTGGAPSGDLTAICVPAPKPVISVNNTMLTSSASLGNQWFKDGVLIPSANEKNYEAVSSGLYTVSTNLSDCPGVPSDAVLVNITGIENESNESLIHFYPNPTNDHLFIQTSKDHRAISSITMFDTMGKMVYQHKGNIDRDWVYDMSKHNGGVYVIRVTYVNGINYTKIIKN